MAVDLGLDDLVERVKDLPANSLGFASNMIALIEAAFLSDRNPFGMNALGEIVEPGDELALDAINTWRINQNAMASLVLPEAMGGSGNYTYSMTDADDTAFDVAGLDFTAATRTLSGTPTTDGTYPVKYTVDDGTNTVSRTFNIVVVPPGAALMVGDPPDRTLTLNVAFSELLPVATGGTGIYVYAVTGSIPDGLDFAADTQILSGTPTATGSFIMTYQVTSGAETAMQEFTYTVEAAGPEAVTRSATDTSVNKTSFITFDSTTGAFDFPASWFAGTPPDGAVQIRIDLQGRLYIDLPPVLESLSTGMNFHSDVEQDFFITFSSAFATDFTVRGPTHTTNEATDTTEPYSWVPDATGKAAAVAFFNSISGGDSMTVTFRYNG